MARTRARTTWVAGVSRTVVVFALTLPSGVVRAQSAFYILTSESAPEVDVTHLPVEAQNLFVRLRRVQSEIDQAMRALSAARRLSEPDTVDDPRAVARLCGLETEEHRLLEATRRALRLQRADGMSDEGWRALGDVERALAQIAFMEALERHGEALMDGEESDEPAFRAGWARAAAWR